MADPVSVQPKFTTIIYETKDGEKVSATKKDGIVTLVGDKNGTRQMDLDKFIKEELVNNVKNINLEKTPEKDSVEISKTAEPKIAEAKETPAATVSEAAPKAGQTAPAESENEEAPAENKLDIVA